MEILESYHIRRLFHIFILCIIEGAGHKKSNGHIIMHISRAMKNLELQIKKQKIVVQRL